MFQRKENGERRRVREKVKKNVKYVKRCVRACVCVCVCVIVCACERTALNPHLPKHVKVDKSRIQNVWPIARSPAQKHRTCGRVHEMDAELWIGTRAL